LANVLPLHLHSKEKTMDPSLAMNNIWGTDVAVCELR